MSGRVCACGCGRTMYGMRPAALYATDACRARAWKDRTNYGGENGPGTAENGSGKLTQTERVVRAIRRAGERGITQVDFLLPHVIDGGRPITRLAARVKDARDAGEQIVVDGERDSCAVYKIAEGVSSASAGPVAVPSPADGGSGQLFDTSAQEFDAMVALSPYDAKVA